MLCTVAIPVFNRPSLVRRAIDSALAQDVDGLEVLAVDNCSTDSTWEVLQSYPDRRLRIAQNPRNLGLAGNLNRCLDLARGKYLRLLCSDDRLPPGVLEQEIQLLEAYPEVSLLSGRNHLVNEAGEIQEVARHYMAPGIYASMEAIYGILWLHAYYGRNPLHYISGILLRRDAVVRAGVFDENLSLYLDLDFLLRALKFGDLAIWNGVGAEVLVHGQQEGVLIGDAAAVGDLFQLANRYRILLQERGTYDRIREQFAGLSLLLAIGNRLRGNVDENRRHRDLQRREDVSWWKMMRGFARMAGLKVLHRTTGVVILPSRFRRSFHPLVTSREKAPASSGQTGDIA